MVSVMSATRFRKSSILTFLEFSSARTVSSSRVSTTRNPLFSKSVFNLWTIDRLTSFSKISLHPTLPGSAPPCPASRTIQRFFVLRFFAHTYAAPARARKNEQIKRYSLYALVLSKLFGTDRIYKNSFNFFEKIKDE